MEQQQKSVVKSPRQLSDASGGETGHVTPAGEPPEQKQREQATSS